MPNSDRRTVLRALLLGTGAVLTPHLVPAAQGPNLHFRVYRSGGQFRWSLRAGNNQVIATSGEGYKTKAACLRGIELVRTGAANAELLDTT